MEKTKTVTVNCVSTAGVVFDVEGVEYDARFVAPGFYVPRDVRREVAAAFAAKHGESLDENAEVVWGE